MDRLRWCAGLCHSTGRYMDILIEYDQKEQIMAETTTELVTATAASPPSQAYPAAIPGLPRRPPFSPTAFCGGSCSLVRCGMSDKLSGESW